MALATRDALLNVGMLHGRSVSDLLNAYNYGTQDQPDLGDMVFATDNFGLRIFRATRIMQSGGMTQGELACRATLVTGTVTAAAGELNDVTHLADTTNFTANNEEGKVCQINVAGAAAPEGENAMIVDNTGNQLTLDSGYPLSAAPAAADTYSDWGIHHGIDATYGINQINVMGLVMSDPDTTGDVAWLQIYGYHPGAIVDAANSPAITADLAGVAGAGGIRAVEAQTSEDFIGFFPMATSTTPTVAGFFIDLWYRQGSLA